MEREHAERDGHTIRLQRDKHLPERCIACNRPTILLRRKFHQRINYRPMWVGLASIALGIIAALSPLAWSFMPLLIVAASIGLFRSESLMLPVGLCGYHNWRRRLPIYVLLSFFVLAAMCGGIAGGAILARGMAPIFYDLAIAVGALGLFVVIGCSILWVATGTPKLSIITADNDFLWIGGAAPEFLASLDTALPRVRRQVTYSAQSAAEASPAAEHVNITA